MRVPRVVRNTLLSAAILAAVFGVGGVVYVKFADGQTTPPGAKPKVSAADYNPLPKPPEPAASAPEGAAIDSLDTPVSPGDNTSMTVQTQPTSKCAISASYGKLVARDSGLVPKTADGYGIVTWSWTIDPAAPAGSWPVKVTCVFRGRSAVVVGSLQVQ